MLQKGSGLCPLGSDGETPITSIPAPRLSLCHPWVISKLRCWGSWMGGWKHGKRWPMGSWCCRSLLMVMLWALRGAGNTGTVPPGAGTGAVLRAVPAVLSRRSTSGCRQQRCAQGAALHGEGWGWAAGSGCPACYALAVPYFCMLFTLPYEPPGPACSPPHCSPVPGGTEQGQG